MPPQTKINFTLLCITFFLEELEINDVKSQYLSEFGNFKILGVKTQDANTSEKNDWQCKEIGKYQKKGCRAFKMNTRESPVLQ